MITVQGSTTVRVPIEAAFQYFGDFSNTQAWDPGVVSSRKLTEGPLKVGDEYAVVARFAGRRLPMSYEVISMDAPHRIVLRGQSSTSSVQDTIEFSQVDHETQITWTLAITLHGPAALLTPAMKPLVDRLVSTAIEGIERACWNGLPQQAAKNRSVSLASA